MPLPEVVRAVTSRAAETMKIQDSCGVLEVGREADITLLKWEDGAFALPDSCGEVRIAPRRLVPVEVFKRGVAHDCQPATLPAVATPAT
jgi:predicted amidohydrolase